MSLSKQNQLKGAKRYIALSFSVVYIKRINNTFLQLTLSAWIIVIIMPVIVLRNTFQVFLVIYLTQRKHT